MTDMRDRLRSFDDLGTPPDVWARAEARGPQPPQEQGPSPWQRAGVAVVSLALAAAAIGFAVSRLGADEPSTFSAPAGGWVVFAASEPEEPSPQGPVMIGTSGDEPPPRTDLYMASPDGSERVRLTNDAILEGPIAWSPDGSGFAFTAYDMQRWVEGLYVMDADGSGRRLVCEACTSTFFVQRQRECGIDSCWGPSATPGRNLLSWSPDGSLIAAVAAETGSVSFVDPITANHRSLEVPGQAYGGSWSPDGGSFAVAVGLPAEGPDAGLYVLDPAEAAIRQLFAAEPGYAPPAWSRDGTTIAFPAGVRVHGDRMAELVFVDAATGEGRVVLGTDAFFEIYDLEWSPDGSRLAVLHHPVEPPSAALLTIGADGTGVRMVALCENGDDTDGLCPPNGGEVVWSPDGRSLVFDNYATADFPWGEERRTLVSLNLDTHAVTPLSVGLDHGCCIASQPGDSPDRSL